MMKKQLPALLVLMLIAAQPAAGMAAMPQDPVS